MKTAVYTFPNISFATVTGLRDILDSGVRLRVRNDEIRELRNRITVLTSPQDRCLFVPGRRHDIFACIAETVWVLAGQNDIAWLSAYLPRAADFSDDGLIWRAAYGPRLRNWNGTDQFKKVRDLIASERATRRAVMSLFDPAQDYVVASRDIPCNNWLHWLVRDGRLHLNIAVRSNDIMWGFSGVNSFEWSTLQQMMARWCDTQAGEATYLASSFHLYKRHYVRAKECVANFRGITCYDFGLVSPDFSTDLDQFDDTLREWMRIEAQLRKTPASPVRPSDTISDAWLAGALEVCRIHHGIQGGWNETILTDHLAKLPETDLAAAACEFFSRKYPQLEKNLPQPRIAKFLAAFRSGNKPQVATDLRELLVEIKKLHRTKDAGYGNAWKRRGEKTSILANIARKIDRVTEFYKRSTVIDGESILDTAIDLFVYATKYRLFLLQQLPREGQRVLGASARQPYSDHCANFDTLTEGAIPDPSRDNLPAKLEREFESLHRMAEENAGLPVRYAQATKLAELALAYVLHTSAKFGFSV